MQKARLEFFEAGDWHITTHSHPPDPFQQTSKEPSKRDLPLTPPQHKKKLALAIAILPGCLFLAGISPCETRGPAIASPVFYPRRSTTMASRSGSASFKAFSTKTLVTMFQMETVKTKMKMMNTAFVTFFLFLYRWFFGFKDIFKAKGP